MDELENILLKFGSTYRLDEPYNADCFLWGEIKRLARIGYETENGVVDEAE